MSFLPRVVSLTRERVSREFDDRGPEICRAEIVMELEAENPELLDMASRCARDVGETGRIMTGFCMFYRVLSLEARKTLLAPPSHGAPALPIKWEGLRLVPRVSLETRRGIVRRIDALGSAAFTRETIDEMELNNPELLQLSHNFAENQKDYAGVMQGFALLYASLSAEALQQRGELH